MEGEGEGVALGVACTPVRYRSRLFLHARSVGVRVCEGSEGGGQVAAVETARPTDRSTASTHV